MQVQDSTFLSNTPKNLLINWRFNSSWLTSCWSTGSIELTVSSLWSLRKIAAQLRSLAWTESGSNFQVMGMLDQAFWGALGLEFYLGPNPAHSFGTTPRNWDHQSPCLALAFCLLPMWVLSAQSTWLTREDLSAFMYASL